MAKNHTSIEVAIAELALSLGVPLPELQRWIKDGTPAVFPTPAFRATYPGMTAYIRSKYGTDSPGLFTSYQYDELKKESNQWQRTIQALK